jgi:hypothetical protein
MDYYIYRHVDFRGMEPDLVGDRIPEDEKNVTMRIKHFAGSYNSRRSAELPAKKFMK